MWCFRLFHKYELINAKPFVNSYGYLRTWLIYRCRRCGHLKQESIDGHYDLYELTAQSLRNVGDLLSEVHDEKGQEDTP